MRYPAAVLQWGDQRIPIVDLDITFHEEPPFFPDGPPVTHGSLTVFVPLDPPLTTNEGSSVEEPGKGSPPA